MRQRFGLSREVSVSSIYEATGTCTDTGIQDASFELFSFTPMGAGARLSSTVYLGTGRAFWSGISSRVAAAEAKALGLKTLERTFSGRLLSATQRFLPRKFVDNSWSRLSTNWARGANGKAHFFGPLGEGAVRNNSYWLTKELPILQGNGMRIIYHYK
jgi:hypothetical protein